MLAAACCLVPSDVRWLVSTEVLLTEIAAPNIFYAGSTLELGIATRTLTRESVATCSCWSCATLAARRKHRGPIQQFDMVRSNQIEARLRQRLLRHRECPWPCGRWKKCVPCCELSPEPGSAPTPSFCAALDMVFEKRVGARFCATFSCDGNAKHVPEMHFGCTFRIRRESPGFRS